MRVYAVSPSKHYIQIFQRQILLEFCEVISETQCQELYARNEKKHQG